MSGKCFFVTSMGKASISLAHNGTIPNLIAANGNPPIPSKRLPMVIMFRLPAYLATAAATVRVVLTAACAV